MSKVQQDLPHKLPPKPKKNDGIGMDLITANFY